MSRPLTCWRHCIPHLISATKLALLVIPIRFIKPLPLASFLSWKLPKSLLKILQFFQSRLREEIGKGLEIIVGDTISTNLASSLGIQGILISSGKRAIYEALSQAEDLAILHRKEAIAQQRLYMILNNLSEGILATDSEHRVTHSNPAAEKYLRLSAQEMLGQNIEAILPGKHRNDELITILDQQYILNLERIENHGDMNGEVFTFKPIKEIQDIETNLERNFTTGLSN